MHNIVGVWFKLATDLEYTSESYMRIWLPIGYEVENDCGFDDFKLQYTRIPNAKEAFPYVFSNLCSNFSLMLNSLASFERLVLGCIEATCCKEILNTKYI